MGAAQVLLIVGYRVCLNPSVGTWEGPALGLWWSRSRFQIRPIHWVVQGRRQTEHWGRGLDWPLRREWGTGRPRQMGGLPVSQGSRALPHTALAPQEQAGPATQDDLEGWWSLTTVHGQLSASNRNQPSVEWRVAPRNLPLHTFLRTTLYPCLPDIISSWISPFRIWASKKVLGVLRRKPCPDLFVSEFSSHSQAMESLWLWDPDFVSLILSITLICVNLFSALWCYSNSSFLLIAPNHTTPTFLNNQKSAGVKEKC